MDIIDIEYYGQYVYLTPHSHNPPTKQENITDYIYNPATHSKYSSDDVNHTFSENYQNLIHNDLYNTNYQFIDSKQHWSPLWMCCKTLSRTEIIENCVIPACITVGTICFVYHIFG
jgi:hypothetical protein